MRPQDILVCALDGGAAFASIALSFIVAFDAGLAVQAYFWPMIAVGCLSALLKPATFFAVGLYSIYWRYVGQREVFRLIRGIGGASAALGLSVGLLEWPLVWLRGIPVSILLVDLLATTVGVSAIRFILHTRLAGGQGSGTRA